MDPRGNIYEGTEENPVKPEDAARLDGYLKGRAEADKPKIETEMKAKLEELQTAEKAAKEEN
jgi:hypothetical protein